MSQSQPVLQVTDLTTQFDTQDGMVHAVNGVSFNLWPGEFLGVVGESGSGKSVTMMSLLRLIPMPPGQIVAGEAQYEGVDLLQIDIDDLRDIRGGKIGFIFQDPMTSLNPVLTVGFQIEESLKIHQHLPSAMREARALELLELVGIPSPEQRLKSYPHELSGGMRQRVMIAVALACSPQILIADEPTTALDVTIQAQIIELIKDLREKLGTAVIWITHDLGVVAGVADRVVVMYGGQIVEEALVDDLYESPKHPYTVGLLGSIPRLDQKGEDLISIPGSPPSLFKPPEACTFAPRCPWAYERCHTENPALAPIEGTRKVACWWDVENDRPRYDH
ncbi:MAG: ABC transporter ATP-binding protein [bacterium]|nr:ABC transporter ATP-binding protein [bacterium]